MAAPASSSAAISPRVGRAVAAARHDRCADRPASDQSHQDGGAARQGSRGCDALARGRDVRPRAGADRLSHRMHARDGPHPPGARASGPYWSSADRRSALCSGLQVEAAQAARGFASKLARLDRQALHAEHLAFVHPTSGTLLKFNSPLPCRSRRDRVRLSRNCEQVAGFYLCDKRFYRETRRGAVSLGRARPLKAAGDGLSWLQEVCRVLARMAD